MQNVDTGQSTEIKKKGCKRCKLGPSMVMVQNEINLCNKRVVLMLNKLCQESFA